MTSKYTWDNIEVPSMVAAISMEGEFMSIKKRGRKFYYDFTLPGYPRMRGVIPEARTKWEAEQAEIKLKREVFENRYEMHQLGGDKLSDFIDNVFLPWSKLNKLSWEDDFYISSVFKVFLREKPFVTFRRFLLRNSRWNDQKP